MKAGELGREIKTQDQYGRDYLGFISPPPAISPGLESGEPKSKNWAVEAGGKSSRRNPFFLV